ncbi:MAG: hypothetical protein NTV81_02005 [Candidatus Komeilibacteria bacterium]|nr:hypothetical protein [Candidatus Komeilibacteria bacterium]
MKKPEIKEIEEKLKRLLGISSFPDYELKIDNSLNKRTAFNKKIGNKYIITISTDKDNKPNLSGFKHELIHLALKIFSYINLDKNLSVSQEYEKDSDKADIFMEYLVIALEIKIGNPQDVEQNLENYEKYGFSEIRYFYDLISNFIFNQTNIDDVIIKVNLM